MICVDRGVKKNKGKHTVPGSESETAPSVEEKVVDIVPVLRAKAFGSSAILKNIQAAVAGSNYSDREWECVCTSGAVLLHRDK